MYKISYVMAAAAAFCVAASANSAARIVPLSSAEERQWIGVVKAHKTADSRTVAQVLALVEKRSLGRFKVASYDVMYDWTGRPSSVSISYWIGTKR